MTYCLINCLTFNFLMIPLTDFNLIYQKFFRKFREFHSEISSIIYGVPQWSKIGPLLFLIYVNDMSLAVKCNLLLHADNPCLLFQKDNVTDLDKQLHQPSKHFLVLKTSSTRLPHNNFTSSKTS